MSSVKRISFTENKCYTAQNLCNTALITMDHYIYYRADSLHITALIHSEKQLIVQWICNTHFMVVLYAVPQTTHVDATIFMTLAQRLMLEKTP